MTTKKKTSVLEYRLRKPTGRKKGAWSFCFKNPEGETVMESTSDFASLAAAEKGFVTMIKFIATNQYEVKMPTTRGSESSEKQSKELCFDM